MVPVLPHHAAPPPLALAAGALALLALVVVRRRPLALALVLVVAMAGFEGVFHAALHLHHVSHPDGLTIGASAAAPTALSTDAEIPAAPTPILLGPAPEHGGELGGRHRSRVPPRTRASRPPRVTIRPRRTPSVFRKRGPGCSSSIEPSTRRAPRVRRRPSGARHPPCEVPMKRVIMSIVLLASTAVAEGQDRAPASAGAGAAVRLPGGREPAARPCSSSRWW